MSNGISHDKLRTLSEAIAVHLGLNYSEDRLGDLRRAVSKAAPELGCRNPDSCVQWLLEPPFSADRMERLADYLTVGETYFLRDAKLFKVFEEQLLPELVEKERLGGRFIRIWSAGCASGEEPYSLAMVLSRNIPDLGNWNVSILATDINRRFLCRAEKGVYGQWSFRDAPEEITENYFSEHADGQGVVPDIKKMVRFSHLNLAKDPLPETAFETQGMDMIFCRNVLMYFTSEAQERVLRRLVHCLKDDGWLIVSPAEASLVAHPNLEQVCFPGVVIFRKKQEPKRFPIFDFHTSEPDPQPVPLLGTDPIDFPSALAIADGLMGSSDPLSETISEHQPTRGSVPGSQDNGNSYREGLDLFHLGMYEEAVSKLREALEQSQVSDGDSAKTMATLARAYANQGQLDEALVWSEKTAETDKLNPEYHFLQGTILEEMGDLERAMISLNRALFLDPNLVVAHFAMGNLARRQGRRQDSDRHYRVALKALADYNDDDALPGADSLTAGRLSEAIMATVGKENRHEES